MQPHKLGVFQTPAGSRVLKAGGWALIALALMALSMRLQVLTTVRSDFTQDYLAAQAALRAESIYAPFTPEQLAGVGLRPDVLQNYHPPLTIALLLHLGLLPYSLAVILWTVFCLGLYVWIWYAVVRELDLGIPAAWGPLLIGLSLLWFPFQFHIILAQLSIPLAACVVGCWLSLRRGRDVLAGALLGLAVLIKLFPALLLLYLVWRRRWRALGAAAAVGAAGLALTLATIGLDNLLVYRETIVPANLATFRSELHNVSLSAAFGRVFVGSEYIAPLVYAPALADLLTAACVGALALLLADTIRRLRASDEGDTLAVALLCAALPVLTPTSWSHSFVLLILPCALLVKGLPGSPTINQTRPLVVAFLLISLPDIALARQIARLYQPALVPWYATLPMLLTMAGVLLLIVLLRQQAAVLTKAR
jgi:hypothetical protein